MADIPAGFRINDPEDPFELAAGPFLEPIEHGGDPRIELPLEARHCNRSGSAHGGLLMTMGDLVLCWVAREGLPDERAITVQFDGRFVAAAMEGERLVGRGQIIRRTGSLCFVRGDIRVGDRIVFDCSAVTKRVPRHPR